MGGKFFASLRQRLGLDRFWRGEEAERGEVRLGQRRVYILPTREGAAYAATVFMILIGSLNYQSSLGYMLSFALASIGLVSMLWTQRNLVGLGLAVSDANPVFAGETATFMVELSSGGKRSRPSLLLTLDHGESVVLDLSEEGGMIELSRGGLARGPRTLGGVTVQTHYPLGLFRAWSPIESGARVLVYPSPITSRAERIPLPPGEVPGNASSGARKGGAEDFYGLREYAKGDLMSRIHWKGLARTGTLSVKEFELPEAFIYGLDFATIGGDVEVRLSLLCGQVMEADRTGAGYMLTLPGMVLGPSKGPAHKVACLEALARFTP